jgi:sulfide:quinone oxidoreductase
MTSAAVSTWLTPSRAAPDGWTSRPAIGACPSIASITQPRLVGPRLRGIPAGRDGFIHTDAHGQLAGLDGPFAAGDATTFPIKQGGLAAQQADAVAETIAASAGADIDPQPFRPILRGVLLTGGRARYMRADISGGAGDDSTISGEALWWPTDKLSGRYLAPYLS